MAKRTVKSKIADSSYYFAVITEVPEDCDGNYACGCIYVNPHSDSATGGSNLLVEPTLDKGEYDRLFTEALIKQTHAEAPTTIDLTVEQLVLCNLPVFRLGEILVMDRRNDRTVPDGRKPGKWCVSYERFDDLDSAVACSKRITGGST